MCSGAPGSPPAGSGRADRPRRCALDETDRYTHLTHPVPTGAGSFIFCPLRSNPAGRSSISVPVARFAPTAAIGYTVRPPTRSLRGPGLSLSASGLPPTPAARRGGGILEAVTGPVTRLTSPRRSPADRRRSPCAGRSSRPAAWCRPGRRSPSAPPPHRNDPCRPASAPDPPAWSARGCRTAACIR